MSETERELGVAVADIGAGTTDIALYADGSPFYTSVIPLGGVNVTNDIAIGLRTNLTAAEQLKMRFGSVEARSADPGTEAPIEIIEDGVARPARKSDVTEIIDARMHELFEKIGEELTENATAHRLPAGLVLTGGGSQLANAAGIGARRAPDPGTGGVAGGRRRADRPSAHAVLRDVHRPAAVGRPRRHERGPPALRAATAHAELGPRPRRDAALLPLASRLMHPPAYAPTARPAPGGSSAAAPQSGAPPRDPALGSRPAARRSTFPLCGPT